MSEVKPLPCPFCNVAAECANYPTTMAYQPAFAVKCLNCFCGTPLYESEQKAITAWNRRATTPERTEVDRELVERVINLSRLHMLEKSKSRSRALTFIEIIAELEKEAKGE